jgi:hypothetical protein
MHKKSRNGSTLFLPLTLRETHPGFTAVAHCLERTIWVRSAKM